MSKNLVKINNLPPEIRKKIQNHAKIGVLVDEEKKKIVAENADIERYVQQWIDTRQSVHTKEVYRREIERFFKFLQDRGIHPALCTALQADEYMIELTKNGYAVNSIRQKLMACSSFYSQMKRYNPAVTLNPFEKMRLPRRKYKKAGSPVMNEEELSVILHELAEKAKEPGDLASIINSRESSKRMIAVVYFLHRYGLRVGAIPTIELKEDFFTVIEKGNKGRRIAYLKDDSFKGAEKKPFSGPGYKVTTIKHAILRLTKKLAASGKIRHPYSCHDFRHYFAAKLYLETKDVYQVKEALGHASVAITDTYLQGIGIL